MLVGPSAPPIIAIEAASLMLKETSPFVSAPSQFAPMKATNTPNCAAAPRRNVIGLAMRGAKSVIAPMPKNMSIG